MLKDKTDYYHCQLMILVSARYFGVPCCSLEYSTRKSMHELINLRGVRS